MVHDRAGKPAAIYQARARRLICRSRSEAIPSRGDRGRAFAEYSYCRGRQQFQNGVDVRHNFIERLVVHVAVIIGAREC